MQQSRVTTSCKHTNKITWKLQEGRTHWKQLDRSCLSKAIPQCSMGEVLDGEGVGDIATWFAARYGSFHRQKEGINFGDPERK